MIIDPFYRQIHFISENASFFVIICNQQLSVRFARRRVHLPVYVLKSDTVAVLAVLPRYPRYYRGNGYNFYGITAVLGPKYAEFPWGWGPVLWYYSGYGFEFFSRT